MMCTYSRDGIWQTSSQFILEFLLQVFRRQIMTGQESKLSKWLKQSLFCLDLKTMAGLHILDPKTCNSTKTKSSNSEHKYILQLTRSEPSHKVEASFRLHSLPDPSPCIGYLWVAWEERVKEERKLTDTSQVWASLSTSYISTMLRWLCTNIWYSITAAQQTRSYSTEV